MYMQQIYLCCHLLSAKKPTGQSRPQAAHAGNSTTCECIWRSGDTAADILNASGYLMVFMILSGLHGGECFLITTMYTAICKFVSENPNPQKFQ
jgi:hypothetical protein